MAATVAVAVEAMAEAAIDDVARVCSASKASAQHRNPKHRIHWFGACPPSLLRGSSRGLDAGRPPFVPFARLPPRAI